MTSLKWCSYQIKTQTGHCEVNITYLWHTEGLLLPWRPEELVPAYPEPAGYDWQLKGA